MEPGLQKCNPCVSVLLVNVSHNQPDFRIHTEFQLLAKTIMKKTLITTALVAVLGGAAPVVFAQADHSAHHGAASAPSAADARLAEGTVKKIDKSAGKLTITHGPLESLGMPAMTMVFRAADPGLLDQVKVGDKIRFAAEKVGDALTVTSVEAVQ